MVNFEADLLNRGLIVLRFSRVYFVSGLSWRKHTTISSGGFCHIMDSRGNPPYPPYLLWSEKHFQFLKIYVEKKWLKVPKGSHYTVLWFSLHAWMFSRWRSFGMVSVNKILYEIQI